MHTLLQIGEDQHLLLSRSLLLQRAGLQVTSSSSQQAATTLNTFFDLLLVSHTVPHTRADEMIRHTGRFWPATRVIRIADGAEMEPFASESIVYFPRKERPGALLRLMERLLRSPGEGTAPAPAPGRVLPMTPEAQRRAARDRKAAEGEQSASAP